MVIHRFVSYGHACLLYCHLSSCHVLCFLCVLAIYKQLTDQLVRDYEPEPLVIAKRFHFHRCDQAPGETIAEYVAELRRLAVTCKFAEMFLDEALHDRFVYGVSSNGTVQCRLLTEDSLTMIKLLI